MPPSPPQTPAPPLKHPRPPSSTRDQNTSSTRDQNTSSTRDQAPSSTRDQSTSSTRDQAPSNTRDQAPSSTRDQSTSSTPGVSDSRRGCGPRGRSAPKAQGAGRAPAQRPRSEHRGCWRCSPPRLHQSTKGPSDREANTEGAGGPKPGQAC